MYLSMSLFIYLSAIYLKYSQKIKLYLRVGNSVSSGHCLLKEKAAFKLTLQSHKHF